jgi:DNA-binding IclR family transcriptional regulator
VLVSPRPPKLVGALTSGLSVLRHLADSTEPLGVTRIARELGLNASTCFNLLRTLVHEGLVNFDERAKTYTIGLGVVELARNALGRASMVSWVQPQLDELAVRHGVTVVTWQSLPDERLVLVHVAEHPGAVRVQMTVGTRVPMFVGASGRCMAAFSGMTKAAIKSRFMSLRWDRAPAFEAYWQSVLDTRKRGFAIDQGHYQRGATVLAVPVFDAAGKPVMTIGCASFSEHMNTARTRALVRELGEVAGQINRALAGPAVTTSAVVSR